jgi:hypothetical protein
VEFEEKLKDAPLSDDDFLMSFDVRALYPNVLIPAANKLLEKWLKSIDLEKPLTKFYSKIA